MSNDYLYYIKGIMHGLGHKQYHIQPLKLNIDSGETKLHIKAYNEHLYLVSETIPADVIIHSDSEIFFSVAEQAAGCLPAEFRGLLTIESSSNDAFSLEFIRVIPE
ncbi:MAG: hypothetical protein H8E61_00255 [Bacteroidetes bacterium]|nr:hypothetical protein [Bacteroidota bacterium]